jgi:hypothetical protein
VVLAPLTSAPAIGPELTHAVPRDHLAAIFVERSTAPAPNATSASGALPSVLGHLRMAGLLGASAGSAGVITDVVTSLGVLEKTPYAIVLTDLEVTRELAGIPPRPALRLVSLDAALIVYTQGHNEEITQQIRALLQTWTTSDAARVEREESDGLTVYTLIDQRAPQWARLHWGAVGDFYVVALGDEAFVSATAAITRKRPCFADEPFVQRNEDDVKLARAEVAWSIDFRRLRTSLREDAERTGTVLDSLGLQNSQRGLWTIRKDERAIVAGAAFATPDGDVFRPLTEPAGDDPLLAQAIPAGADAYAVFPTSVAELVLRGKVAYLATCSPAMRQLLAEHWNAFATAAGLDLERDLLAHLGDRVVIHTFPRHPLGVRVLVTILVEIDGSADAVRRALDKILAQCNLWMAGRPDESGRPPDRGWFAPCLRRAEDGVWYLQVGITGPALAVTDRWIVISFSPAAVRECLAAMSPPAEAAP